jgi:hypothetical protein
MSDDWLEIADESIDVEEIMRRIRERIAQRSNGLSSDDVDPAVVARDLWKEMIGDPMDDTLGGKLASIRPRDCDIVPRYYEIDWRIPILGPIHAIVRRIVNAEIRRYLTSSLEKQSSLNRKMLQVLKGLAEENVRLRQEIQELARPQARDQE